MKALKAGRDVDDTDHQWPDHGDGGAKDDGDGGDIDDNDIDRGGDDDDNDKGGTSGLNAAMRVLRMSLSKIK